MEFLVNIRIDWGNDKSEAWVREITQAEHAMAADLAERGHLLRMWRVPGRRENWGLWWAEDATELHAILSALPVWPWMDLDVHPLGRHAVDPGAPMALASSLSDDTPA